MLGFISNFHTVLNCNYNFFLFYNFFFLIKTSWIYL